MKRNDIRETYRVLFPRGEVRRTEVREVVPQIRSILVV
jgi:hypothetical protein